MIKAVLFLKKFNLSLLICFHSYKCEAALFDQYIGPKQQLQLQVRVYLGVMAIKGYPHSPKSQPYWNVTMRLLNVIYRTLVGRGFFSLNRNARCILQLLSNADNEEWEKKLITNY